MGLWAAFLVALAPGAVARTTAGSLGPAVVGPAVLALTWALWLRAVRRPAALAPALAAAAAFVVLVRPSLSCFDPRGWLTPRCSAADAHVGRTRVCAQRHRPAQPAALARWPAGGGVAAATACRLSVGLAWRHEY